MAKLIYSFLILMLIGHLASSDASAQTVDRIISRYLHAIGGYKKLKAISTLRLTGVYREDDLTANTMIEAKRPNLRLVTVGDPGAAYLEGYDGISWEYSQPRDQLKLTAGFPAEAVARRGAEFDESIVDYKAKGDRVKLVGRERVLGKDTFHLEVTLADGWSKSYYIDSRTYLIVALLKAMPLHAKGPDIVSLSSYEDYHRVAGVLIPHSFVEKKVATGEVMNSLKWDRIEANVDLNNAIFSPPAKKTPH
jgi:hypothetical protein